LPASNNKARLAIAVAEWRGAAPVTVAVAGFSLNIPAAGKGGGKHRNRQEGDGKKSLQCPILKSCDRMVE
jgi:hypothetical protein